ncbi:MAG: tetratricopeptide repeat protein [Planctomycetes bacterium]|nr:tetratricopeptide repeat protein [Planctomycetota bacterium]
MKGKLWIVVGVAVVLVGAAALAWYLMQPKSAEQQYRQAQQAEIKLQAEAAELTEEQLAERRTEIIREYEKVWTDFPDDGYHDDARQRVAEIYDEFLKDKTAALDRYRELLEKHPDSDKAEAVVHRMAELCEELGLAEKDDREAALKLFREAVDLREKFIEQHPDSPRVEEDLIHIVRLWQDQIQDPPIETKNRLTCYLEKFPDGKYTDEALFRLGRWYEDAEMPQDAIVLYKRLVEEYPQSQYVERANERQYEIYAKKLNDEERAAEMARKIAQRNPGTAKGARYAQQADSAEQKQIKEKDRQYEKDYYGAPIYDAALDKPFPWEEFEDLLAQKVDTIGYKLDVRLSPADGTLEVVGGMELVNNGEDMTELLLQFNVGMTLADLKLDGAPAEVVSPSSARREVACIRLPRALAKGQGGTLTFKASGKFEPPQSVPEGVDLATGETPDEQQLQKIMQTMSGDMRVRVGETGYAIASGLWYPLTLYGDMFTTDVTYHLPQSGYEVSAAGRMTAPEGEGTVRRYVSQTPIFGIYFAYGKFVPIERPWSDGRTVVAYVTDDKRDLGKQLADQACDILTFYEAKFGALKQPRISITINKLPAILGGIGPAGMMMLAEHFIRDDDVPVSLLAHELSHQWWGNHVPISFEKGYSMWLSEGFATYCDALYNEKLHGRQFLTRHLEKYSLFYFEGLTQLPRLVQPTASCYMNNPLYRQTVYEKGALTLHALRYLLGDEKFFTIMRRYAQEYEGKHSTIEDVRRIADEVSGLDLRWFFDQWLRRKDLPHYVVTDLVADAENSGQYVLTVRQETPGTEGPWRMPLDIAFYGADGAEHVERRVALEEEENRVVVRLDFKPQRVVLDPDYWVFRYPGPDNVWPKPVAPLVAPAPADEQAD